MFSFLLQISEILGERKSRRGKEYLVRWKGFGDEQDSWEPFKHLKHAVQAIAEFHGNSLTVSFVLFYWFFSLIIPCKGLFKIYVIRCKGSLEKYYFNHYNLIGSCCNACLIYFSKQRKKVENRHHVLEVAPGVEGARQANPQAGKRKLPLHDHHQEVVRVSQRLQSLKHPLSMKRRLRQWPHLQDVCRKLLRLSL